MQRERYEEAIAAAGFETGLAWVLTVLLLVASGTVTLTNWCMPSFVCGLLHEQPGNGRAVGSSV